MNFNGTTRNIEDMRASNPKDLHVDEVVIWNRSLSASEIRNHYMRGAANLTLQTRTGSYYENSNPRRVLSLHFTPNPVNFSQVLDDSGICRIQQDSSYMRKCRIQGIRDLLRQSLNIPVRNSHKGNHGTITGAHFSEGKLGSALVFDGVNDYVAVEVRE